MSLTLRSIALNYIQRASRNAHKALVKALNRLKKRDCIIITIRDKGSGVVMIDKAESREDRLLAEYTRLLSAASIDDTSKFVHINDERPKSRGRPPSIPSTSSEEERKKRSFT